MKATLWCVQSPDGARAWFPDEDAANAYVKTLGTVRPVVFPALEES